MHYSIFLHKKAANELKKLPPEIQKRIKKEISKLSENPKKGKHLLHCEFWSLRIGDYRAIYEFDKKENKITILFVGHRKNVYSDFSKLFWGATVLTPPKASASE